ncbi:signal peptidase I [Streptomyces sp. NPDC051211]|uniref:signal peptidase I n=1 Tax=Streptomyces sp. NPDC051211 TaxID=3154643 RepID=UPI00344D38D5
MLLVLGAGLLLGTPAVGLVTAPEAYEVRTLAGRSMEPTYRQGERLFFRAAPGESVRRGQVVLVEVPWVPQGELVTRVVAADGDRISYSPGSRTLMLNGEPLDEPYLPEGVAPAEAAFDVVVPQGQMFLMGDNRAYANDSRYSGNGPVDLAEVHGIAVPMPVAHSVLGGAGLLGVPVLLAGAGLGIGALVARRRAARQASAGPVYPAYPAYPVCGSVRGDGQDTPQ